MKYIPIYLSGPRWFNEDEGNPRGPEAPPVDGLLAMEEAVLRRIERKLDREVFEILHGSDE